MRYFGLVFGLVLTVALAVCGSARSVEISVLADKDNTLQGDGDFNSGAQSLMNADLKWGGSFEGRRSIIHFDISGIADGQQIDSAILTLTGFSGDNAADKAFKIYSLTTDWSEGSKTAGATLAPGEVGSTRTYAKNELGSPAGLWDSPMGDYDLSSVVNYTATGNILNVDITSIAESWYLGPNYGLIVIADQAGSPAAWLNTRQNFYSSEAGSGLAPALNVAYSVTTVPEPSAMLLYGTGMIVLAGIRRFRRKK
jgi:hypothetical protein